MCVRRIVHREVAGFREATLAGTSGLAGVPNFRHGQGSFRHTARFSCAT